MEQLNNRAMDIEDRKLKMNWLYIMEAVPLRSIDPLSIVRSICQLFMGQSMCDGVAEGRQVIEFYVYCA